VNRLVFCSLLGATIVLSAVAAPSAANENFTTSHWQVYAWIGQQVVSGVMTMTQTGNKVSATFHGNTIAGTMTDATHMNATWSGPRGEGWITLAFHNEGNGFGGTWGPKGKASDGRFVGTRITPSPAPSGP
jgi:hypothetical protein